MERSKVTRTSRERECQLHLSVRPATLGLFVRLLQVSPRLVQSALSIVVSLNGLTIFVRRALALPGDVKNLAELNVAPDLRPTRLAIPVQAIAICIGRRLKVVLQEKYFGHAIVCQRAVLVNLKRLVELC